MTSPVSAVRISTPLTPANQVQVIQVHWFFSFFLSSSLFPASFLENSFQLPNTSFWADAILIHANGSITNFGVSMLRIERDEGSIYLNALNGASQRYEIESFNLETLKITGKTTGQVMVDLHFDANHPGGFPYVPKIIFTKTTIFSESNSYDWLRELEIRSRCTTSSRYSMRSDIRAKLFQN